MRSEYFLAEFGVNIPVSMFFKIRSRKPTEHTLVMSSS